jgi:hypothetical protein
MAKPPTRDISDHVPCVINIKMDIPKTQGI